MSLDDEFQRALAATKKTTRKPKAKPAISRYGYLVVRWPIIEDELGQSGGGPVMLGEEDDLTISRSSHPNSKKAHEDNLARLKQDVARILGGRFKVVSHNGYLFLKPGK